MKDIKSYLNNIHLRNSVELLTGIDFKYKAFLSSIKTACIVM